MVVIGKNTQAGSSWLSGFLASAANTGTTGSNARLLQPRAGTMQSGYSAAGAPMTSAHSGQPRPPIARRAMPTHVTTRNAGLSIPAALTGATLVLGSMLYSADTLAGSKIPDFRSDQHLYCVTRCPFDEAKVEASLDNADFPFYVVWQGSLGVGESQLDTEIERHTKKIRESWAGNGFDTAYGTITVIAKEDGITRTWPGSYWQGQGFNENKLSRVQDRIQIPKLKAGDNAGAIRGFADGLTVEYNGYLKPDITALTETIGRTETLLANPYLLPSDNTTTIARELSVAKQILAKKDFKNYQTATSALAKAMQGLDETLANRQTANESLQKAISQANLLLGQNNTYQSDNDTLAIQQALAKALASVQTGDTDTKAAAAAKLVTANDQAAKNVAARKKAESDLRTLVASISSLSAGGAFFKRS